MKSDISAKEPPAIKPAITCKEHMLKQGQLLEYGRLERSIAQKPPSIILSHNWVTYIMPCFMIKHSERQYLKKLHHPANLIFDDEHLHTGRVVILPDVLEDGVETLEGGTRKAASSQL